MNPQIAQRTKMLWWSFLALIFIFGGRIFYLQIVRGEFYKELSVRNRLQVFYRQAPRGLILDARHQILAANVGVFNLYFNPNMIVNDPSHASTVARILKMEPAKFQKELQNARTNKRTSQILNQLPTTLALRFLERASEFPEFFLADESLRIYPFGEDFSHLLGYLTKLQSRAVYEEIRGKGYRFDSWIGRFGLEKTFEETLKGSDGAAFFLVDVHGRPQSSVKRGLTRSSYELTQDPYPGANILLTLNGRLSRLAHELLRKTASKRGSVVGLDPQTGAVKVLAITPGFDPNAYIRKDSGSKTSPSEFPRAFVGLYPPGSVFKIITSIAALQNEKFDTKKTFFCKGFFQTPQRAFKCWKQEGHGPCDFFAGLKNSCDVYFYHLGLFLGPEAMNQWAKALTLGSSMAIREFPEWKSSGFIPSPAAKKRLKRESWFPGDSINMAIGQGETLATPLQLACLISMVASRGVLHEPYLVAEVQDPYSAEAVYRAPSPSEVIKEASGVSAKTWRVLEEGLRLVVEEGTGMGMKMPGLKIYGKTGTAQNPHGQDHALFVCYLKDAEGRPRLAMSVVVDQGGKGSAVALPIAREIVKEFALEEGLLQNDPT